jgi:ribose/xylose/arabinose/galactoside ABC-type transport system permease subunit
MAFPIIGGTSISGGKATIVGSYLGSYIIGMIEAGLVATGMQSSGSAPWSASCSWRRSSFT